MQSRNLRIAAVYGGVGIQKQAKSAARAHVIVATPGRLEDLLGRGAVSLRDIRILVLDEADRMLDLGFKPTVDRIVAMTPRKRQTLFLPRPSRAPPASRRANTRAMPVAT